MYNATERNNGHQKSMLLVCKNSNFVVEYCCLMANHFLDSISLRIFNMADMR